MLAAVRSIVLLFWSPTESLGEKEKAVPVAWLFVLLIALNVLAEYLIIPFKVEVMKEFLRTDMGPSHVQAWTAQFKRSMHLGLFFVPLMELVKLAVASSFLWAFGVLLSPVEFGQIFKILVVTAFVVLAGELLGIALLYMTPAEAVDSPLDLINQFGIHLFFSPHGLSESVRFFLSEINVFSLWRFYLVAVLFGNVTKESLQASVLVVLPVWLVSVLIRFALFNLGPPDLPIEPFL